jgi:hypothetical protein
MKLNLVTLAKGVRAVLGPKRGRLLCSVLGHVKPTRADVQHFHAAAKPERDDVGPLNYGWTRCPRCGEPWL